MTPLESSSNAPRDPRYTISDPNTNLRFSTNKAHNRRSTSLSKDSRDQSQVPNNATRRRRYQPHLLLSEQKTMRFVQLDNISHGYLPAFPQASPYSRLHEAGIKLAVGLRFLPKAARAAPGEQRDVSIDIMVYRQHILQRVVQFLFCKDNVSTKAYFFPESSELMFSVENHPTLRAQFWVVSLLVRNDAQMKHMQHFWGAAQSIFTNLDYARCPYTNLPRHVAPPVDPTVLQGLIMQRRILLNRNVRSEYRRGRISESQVQSHLTVPEGSSMEEALSQQEQAIVEVQKENLVTIRPPNERPWVFTNHFNTPAFRLALQRVNGEAGTDLESNTGGGGDGRGGQRGGGRKGGKGKGKGKARKR